MKQTQNKPPFSHQTMWHIIALFYGAILCFGVISCAEPNNNTDPLPTLQDLTPILPNTQDNTDNTDNIDNADNTPNNTQNNQGTFNSPLPIYGVSIQKLLFDRDDERVELALGLLAEAKIDPAKLALWKANGFAIAQLNFDRLALLRANLPKELGTSNYFVSQQELYYPITLVSKVGKKQRVKYFTKPNRNRTLKISEGSYQLLAKIIQPTTPKQRPTLQLRPHHYKPKPALQPRSAAEKMLEGTNFRSLVLLEKMPEDKVWIIWYNPNITKTSSEPLDDTTNNNRDNDQKNATNDITPAAPAKQFDATHSKTKSSSQKNKVNQLNKTDHTNNSRLAKPAKELDRGQLLAKGMLTGIRQHRPVQAIIVIIPQKRVTLP